MFVQSKSFLYLVDGVCVCTKYPDNKLTSIQCLPMIVAATLLTVGSRCMGLKLGQRFYK